MLTEEDKMLIKVIKDAEFIYKDYDGEGMYSSPERRFNFYNKTAANFNATCGYEKWTGETIKARWNYIRDAFRRASKKVNEAQSESVKKTPLEQEAWDRCCSFLYEVTKHRNVPERLHINSKTKRTFSDISLDDLPSCSSLLKERRMSASTHSSDVELLEISNVGNLIETSNGLMTNNNEVAAGEETHYYEDDEATWPVEELIMNNEVAAGEATWPVEELFNEDPELMDIRRIIKGINTPTQGKQKVMSLGCEEIEAEVKIISNIIDAFEPMKQFIVLTDLKKIISKYVD